MAPSNLLMNWNIYDEIETVQNYVVPPYSERYPSETFKALDPNKVHTAFRDNKPLAGSQKTPWLLANPPNFNSFNAGPKAVTIVGW